MDLLHFLWKFTSPENTAFQAHTQALSLKENQAFHIKVLQEYQKSIACIHKKALKDIFKNCFHITFMIYIVAKVTYHLVQQYITYW